ncbi:PREDICTED: DNA polymerase delta subunit 4-like [Populus euphratica]|uniref:DNA polymerase delta subunit 4-like n=1 Tax=Populus euphratica TaxID=75702 RepID=A0AAJ6VC91_POPEU|nr:PREDICTED: DNA polymerase delta subunit 4-like [Populus euphratica]
MATASSNMKGFYRQKKNKHSGITKPTSSKKSSLHHIASLVSDITQPPALISHGSPDHKDYYDEHEELLRQFDMNMAYGPCLGMSRLARWGRAQRLGLNPPNEFEGLLKAEMVRSECWWDGRV